MLNTTVDEILRKETKKKNFYLEKLEKMKNAMARKVVIVVRIKKSQPYSMFRIAAKFTEIDEKDRKMINTTVEAMLRKKTKYFWGGVGQDF